MLLAVFNEAGPLACIDNSIVHEAREWMGYSGLVKNPLSPSLTAGTRVSLCRTMLWMM